MFYVSHRASHDLVFVYGEDATLEHSQIFLCFWVPAFRPCFQIFVSSCNGCILAVGFSFQVCSGIMCVEFDHVMVE